MIGTTPVGLAARAHRCGSDEAAGTADLGGCPRRHCRDDCCAHLTPKRHPVRRAAAGPRAGQHSSARAAYRNDTRPAPGVESRCRTERRVHVCRHWRVSESVVCTVGYPTQPVSYRVIVHSDRSIQGTSVYRLHGQRQEPSWCAGAASGLGRRRPGPGPETEPGRGARLLVRVGLAGAPAIRLLLRARRAATIPRGAVLVRRSSLRM